MERSRLGRAGQNSLALLQEISPNHFEDDQLIQNQSTFFYNELGAHLNETQIANSSVRQPSNQQDLYSLPLTTQKITSQSSGRSNTLGRRAREEGRNEIQQGMNEMRRSAGSNQSILNTKRARAKRNQRVLQRSQPDFIGGDLFEVQDIINDIRRIMQDSKRTKVVKPAQEAYKPKWNNKFSAVNKLDEMLMNYRTTADQEPIPIPITDDFYRQTPKSSPFSSELGDLPIVREKKSKIGGGFGAFKVKNSDSPKLSLVVVKWNEMPLILGQWEASFYLKLQSYPQNEAYKRVALKALQNEVISYSIFSQLDAGLASGQQANDKNKGQQQLMSEEEYAKKWDDVLQNADSLSEEQKESLMEFDIQWYRTLVDFVYHSGLEVLLEKQYDVALYAEAIANIHRVSKPTSNLLIENQLKYLQGYFSQVYSYSTNELVIAAIKINNDNKASTEQLKSYFASALGSSDALCVLPLDESGSTCAVAIGLRGSGEHLQVCPRSIKLNIPNSDLLLELCSREEDASQGVKIVLKGKADNDWEFQMKATYNNGPELKFRLAEEMLFGVMYNLDGLKAKE